MLAYLKNPMGYNTLDGQRVYGRSYSFGTFGPTDLSQSTYNKYKDKLEEAEYTTKWLEHKYNRQFPSGLSFKVSTIRQIDFKQLVELAWALGINFTMDFRTNPTTQEKNALVKSVLSHL